MNENRRRIRHSDKYYLGYVNWTGKKRVVVIFDPKKIKSVMEGDIKWFDYCQPFVVALESKQAFFGFPLLSPDE